VVMSESGSELQARDITLLIIRIGGLEGNKGRGRMQGNIDHKVVSNVAS
jgi:hypothetical protein